MSDTQKAFTDLLAAVDFEAHLRKRFAASWFVADRLERRARMQVITTLLLELERIRSVSIFATGLGQGLDGDWDGVSVAAGFFLFEEESDECRGQYVPLWNTFRVLALGAVVEARHRSEGNPTKAS